MNLSGVLFLFVALITLVAAWRVVVSERIMHAALWLALTFFGTAVAFLMLNADFVAAAQVLVYVGAITVLLIFGVMLSGATEVRGDTNMTFWERITQSKGGNPVRAILPLLAASAFAVLMIVLYHLADLRIYPAESVITDTPHAIGLALFDTYVIPFEVASLVLLVGLVGAIVLATREEGE